MNENGNTEKGNRKKRMTSRKKENDKTKIRKIMGRNRERKPQLERENRKYKLAHKKL